jgi:hypothetical protein
VATTRSPHERPVLERVGADAIVVTSGEELAAGTKRATGGKGDPACEAPAVVIGAGCPRSADSSADHRAGPRRTTAGYRASDTCCTFGSRRVREDLPNWPARVTGLTVHPVVGTIVEAAGDLAVSEFRVVRRPITELTAAPTQRSLLRAVVA